MREILKKISILVGVVALVTSSVESIKHFSSLINNNFWIIYFLALIFSLIPLWPETPKNKIGYNSPATEGPLFKYKWIMLLTTCFLVVAMHRVYTVYLPSKGQHPVAQPIPVRDESQKNITPFNLEEFTSNQKTEINTIDTTTLNDNHSSNKIVEFSGKSSTDAKKTKKGPIITQFGLNPLKTSFIETTAWFEAVGPKTYPTFQLNPSFHNKNNPEECQCGWEYSEYDKTVEALKRYTELSNKQELNKYFSTFINLEYIVTRHPDVAQKLIPSSDEWSRLSQEDYNTILRWTKCCIGIPYPTFIFSIENPNEAEMVVQEVFFNVLKIGQVMSAEDGVLVPSASYVFEIEYALGTQRKNLMPAGFRIPATKTRSFEITLFTNHKDLGLCWFMDVEFKTDKGNCKTKTFQLIMSGKPEWFQGNFK